MPNFNEYIKEEFPGAVTRKIQELCLKILDN